MIDERPHKIIATAPGEPDIVVPFTDEEWAIWKAEQEAYLAQDHRPILSGAILVDRFRLLFAGKTLAERIAILGGDVNTILAIVEKEPIMTQADYNDLRTILTSAMTGKISAEEIGEITALADAFVNGYKL